VCAGVVGKERWVDILAEPASRRFDGGTRYPEVTAVRGLRVTHKATGFTGALARIERDGIVLKGVTGLERVFRLAPGAYAIGAATVTLVAPRPARPGGAPTAPHTASGSTARPTEPARVARSSRILVEGVHDAELVERIWGDDLRGEGVVVERLDGLDHLPAVIAEFRPGPNRRLGVLVDHLVTGSKESQIARHVDNAHVLITGTPFIDVWQAVRPSVVGIPGWPDIPHGIDWKTGVCRRLGVSEPAMMWRRILASVNDYTDLAPALVGAVEQLIDFVTEPDAPVSD
jgi:hypothetical protein